MLRRSMRGDTVARREHGIALAAAAGLVALALAGGGYGAPARAVASLALWWLVALGALTGLLPLGAPARAGRRLVLLLAGLTLLTGVSLAWAGDADAAFERTALAALHLALALLVLLTLTEASAAAWLRGAAVGLVAIAGLALASRIFPGAITDPVAAELPAARARLSFPIGYWNALALAMASALVLLAWLACAAATRAGRSAAAAALPLPALALYLTSSRGGVLALLAGLVLLLALERRRLALAASLALAAVPALALVAAASTRGAFVDGLGDASAPSYGISKPCECRRHVLRD